MLPAPERGGIDDVGGEEEGREELGAVRAGIVQGPEYEECLRLVIELGRGRGGDAEEKPRGDGDGENDKGERGEDDGGQRALGLA